MSTLTIVQRRQLPLSDFAWPEQRKFPVLDQSDLDAAAILVGRAPASKQDAIRAAIRTIAKRKGLTLPESWQSP